MHTPFWKPGLSPGTSPADEEAAEPSAGGRSDTLEDGTKIPSVSSSGIAAAHEASLNLAENFDSLQQQEILDALPVLVFLERAGKVV